MLYDNTHHVIFVIRIKGNLIFMINVDLNFYRKFFWINIFQFAQLVLFRCLVFIAHWDESCNYAAENNTKCNAAINKVLLIILFYLGMGTVSVEGPSFARTILEVAQEEDIDFETIRDNVRNVGVYICQYLKTD